MIAKFEVAISLSFYRIEWGNVHTYRDWDLLFSTLVLKVFSCQIDLNINKIDVKYTLHRIRKDALKWG